MKKLTLRGDFKHLEKKSTRIHVHLDNLVCRLSVETHRKQQSRTGIHRKRRTIYPKRDPRDEKPFRNASVTQGLAGRVYPHIRGTWLGASRLLDRIRRKNRGFNFQLIFQRILLCFLHTISLHNYRPKLPVPFPGKITEKGSKTYKETLPPLVAVWLGGGWVVAGLGWLGY